MRALGRSWRLVMPRGMRVQDGLVQGGEVEIGVHGRFLA
jgi:hypothetical protein